MQEAVPLGHRVCGPCHMQGQLSWGHTSTEEMGDKVMILKVDVDENPETARALWSMTSRLLLIKKDGEVVK